MTDVYARTIDRLKSGEIHEKTKSLDDVARDWLMHRGLYDPVQNEYLQHDTGGVGYGPTKNSYSSPYYDYQKAHEYYEQHKQLKGRTRSKSQLSDEGKEVWEVTQHNIKKAKEAETQSMSEQVKGQIQTIQDSIAQLKTLAAGQRGAKKAAIQARIESLRTSLATKKEQLKSVLKTRQEGIKSDNEAMSEAVKKENAKVGEKAKADKERNTQNTSRKIEQLQAKSKTLGSSANDKREKEQIKQTIAKLRTEKSVQNANIGAKATAEKAENSAGLKSYKAYNSEELKKYRAENASQVKSASEGIKSSIAGLRTELSDYNKDNRERQKGGSDEMRAAIKELRQINSENRKKLVERYKEISNAEFDKIAERYPNTKKKK